MKKYFLIMFSIFMLNGCATAPTAQEVASLDYGSFPVDYKNNIETYLNMVLKDPDSKRIEFLGTPKKMYNKFGGGISSGYAVCAYVNAKNSYGGFTGAKLSWFLIKNDRVIQSFMSTTRDSFETMQAEKGCEVVASAPAENSSQNSTNKKDIQKIELADDNGKSCKSDSDCESWQACRSKKGGGGVCKVTY